MKPIIKLIISIIICQLAGIIGSIFTRSSVSTWYKELIKPGFNPPNWTFSVVWITLFLLMGISFYIIWIKGFTKPALIFFIIQLILNILWSMFFFGLKNPLLAFIELIILWIAILITIILFYNISKTAGYLLIPYILWVTFAAILNYYLIILN